MKRVCTTCLASGKQVEAKFVAGDASELLWFECADHGPRDNPGGFERTSLVPIAEWLHAFGLPDNAFDDEEPVPPTERNVSPQSTFVLERED